MIICFVSTSKSFYDNHVKMEYKLTTSRHFLQDKELFVTVQVDLNVTVYVWIADQSHL
jgi:hypothetical protein